MDVRINGINTTLPGRWTWRLQFPTAEGTVTQLNEMTLRIGLRVHHPDGEGPMCQGTYHSAYVPRLLLKMLEQRDAETKALWTTY